MKNDQLLTRPLDGGYQSITTSGTSAATSNAFGDQIDTISVTATQDVHIVVGKTPTATTSDFFLPKNVNMFFRVRGGDKLAAIQSSAAGTVHVSEMTH